MYVCLRNMNDLTYTFPPRYKRIVAYLLDVIPITLFVFGVFFYGLGFDKLYYARLDFPNDPLIREDFLADRNLIRNYSFLVWVIYSILMEISPWQGTLGKRVMGLQVTSIYYERLTLVQAVKRNATKIISLAIFGLGFIWFFFDIDQQSWHDKFAKTLVVEPQRN